MSYSKHKERQPKDTVQEIRRILNEAGLFPIEMDTSGISAGASSNRVFLYPLQSLGQNGKGTDPLYASASGHAELMERIENGWITQNLRSPALIAEQGFYEFPDERLMTPQEILAQKDPYLSDLLIRLGCILTDQRELFLKSISKDRYGREDGLLPCVPYVDVFADQIVWLPFAVITLFAISNGMSAGNTLEEALVQGMSELFERYVHKRLLEGKITPPEIPPEKLNESLRVMIEGIEKNGRYKVSVRDCSLGEGYPASCVIITNLDRGTFGMKPGCHPSFAVSVERTLTEAFQGKNLDSFTGSCRTGSMEEVLSYHNIVNLMRIGIGVYPSALIAKAGEQTYPLQEPWADASNGEYLTRLLALAHERGFRPLVRDASYMGFPAYHVLIAGIHDLYPVSWARLRDFRTQRAASLSMNHFPDLTEEEEGRLLRCLKFKDGSADYLMGNSLLHEFTGKQYEMDRIEAFLALKAGEFALAARLFMRRAEKAADDEEKHVLRCWAAYARFRAEGNSKEDAHALLRALFRADNAETVCRDSSDDAELLRKAFPESMKCFDCTHCALAGKDCRYPEAEEILRKISKAMKASNVSVEALQEKLRPYAEAAQKR